MADHGDNTQNDSQDDYYDDVPLHEKQPFGAGLHCQKVNFVPASDTVLKTTTAGFTSEQPSISASDFYLSLVLPEDKAIPSSSRDKQDKDDEVEASTCEVCNLPISSHSALQKDGLSKKAAHETSIAHQFCLSHSHPPSAIDRSRMGLAVLSSQGWDPDSRTGLGAVGQGIRDPVTATEKNNNLGLGMKVPKEVLTGKGRGVSPAKVEKKFDAKQARKKAEGDMKKHQALINHFYGNPDVERYLGEE